MRFILLSMCGLLVALSQLNAQYYSSGQAPFSVKWQQINTNNFQVIFPDHNADLGKKYASYLERIYQSGSESLGHAPTKIPVLIHTEGVLSNGEVSWVPKRMNLYPTSPQYGVIMPFEQTLLMHEFRHVAQIDKLNQRGTRVLYYFLGEQAVAGVLGWHVPLWFLEGDAVAYETGGSKGGRGVTPDFSMRLKAQLMHRGKYSYPKAMLGSYKDFVPNAYELGYFLTGEGRRMFGDDIWDKTLLNVARWPININSFSGGIKKVSGLPERKFYSTVMDSLSLKFAHELGNNTLHEDQTKKKADYSNYHNPIPTASGIMAYKTSYAKVPEFILIDSLGKEQSIVKPGIMLNASYSFANDYLVWNEFRSTRWSTRNFNRIAVYHVPSKKKHFLERKGAVFSTRVSPDGSQIISAEQDDEFNWSLTIRDISRGEMLKSFELGAMKLSHPSWSPNMKEVVFMALSDQGRSLGLLSIASGEIEWILQHELLDLSYPKHYGDYITVNGVYGQASNVFKYNISKKEWLVLSNEPYGIGESTIKNNTLYFSRYTQNGYRIVQQKVGESIKHSKPESYVFQTAEYLKNREQLVDFNYNDSSFTISKYGRFAHLLNLHSWAPFAINFSNMELGPGVTLLSQNVLSSAVLTAGYQYYNAEKRHETYIDFSYKGFYPLLSTRLSYDNLESSIEDMGQEQALHIKRWDLATKIELPLVFNSGPWFRQIKPSVSYDFIHYNSLNKTTGEIDKQWVHGLKYRFYAYNIFRSAYRDLQSKWGQVINVEYQHTPFNGNGLGQIALASGSFYFPSLFTNHGLRMYAAYQYRMEGEDNSFSDLISYPYGYHYVKNDEMVALHLNYRLPLWYPDLNAWEVLYIKRLKANLFYQYNNGVYLNQGYDLQSVGMDLSADFHFARFIIPMEVGVRYSRKLSFNQNYFGLLFSFNVSDL